MTRRQGLIATVLGVVLWFCAALLVHLAREVFDGGGGSLTMFAVAILTSGLTVLAFERLGRASRQELIAMMAWANGLALMLDGVGVTFAPSLYAGVSSASQFGLAVIAWGAGLGLLFAFSRGRVPA